MFKLFALLPVLAVFASPATATVAKITKFGVNGSGCPPGSTTTQLIDGDTTLVSSFSQFIPQVSAADFRQFCQATIEVSLPAGKQFTLSGVEYSGYVQLSSKVAVTHQSLYYFQGETDQRTSSDVIWGPMTGEEDLSNTFKDNAIWSSCHSELDTINVKIALIIEGKKGSGYTTVDGAKIGPFVVRDC